MANEPARDSDPTLDEEERTTDDDSASASTQPQRDINEGRRQTEREPGSGDDTGSGDSTTTSSTSSPGMPDQNINQDRRATDATSETSTQPVQRPEERAEQAQASPEADQQGVEASGVGEQPRQVRQEARALEQDVVEQDPRIDDTSEVAVRREDGQLQAELTETGESDILAGRRQRAQQRRDAQTGRTAARIASFETRVRREFAEDNPGVEPSDVTVTGTEGGDPQVVLNDEAQQAAAGLTPAEQQGGRRRLQEASLEQRATEAGGDPVSPGEVEADVTDEGVSLSTSEVAPVVASRQGGRQALQAAQIRSRAAQRTDGIAASQVDANLTATGADPELTESGRESLIEQQIVESRDDIREGEVTASITDSGEVDVDVSDEAQRRQLREQAEEQFPNAEEITITEDDGELVAEIERENDIETIQRYGENFVDDPIGSLTEGTTEITTDLAQDTEEFAEGGIRGAQNPGDSLNWAISGVEENTIDPVVSNVESFTQDPVGSAQSGVRDVAGGVVSLAQGGAEFSGGIARGAVNVGERSFNAISSNAESGIAGAALPIAFAEPTPVGETVVGSAALGGTVAAGAFFAGQEAGDVYDRGFETTLRSETDAPRRSNKDANELQAPRQRREFAESELTVDEETGIVQQEIEVNEDVDLQNAEIRVPENVDRSEVTIEDGSIRAPVEVTPSVQIGRERGEETEEDDSETDEVGEGEIVIDLPEDSPYSPDEILEPDERPARPEEPRRTPDETPAERDVSEPTTPQQQRERARQEPSIVDSGFVAGGLTDTTDAVSEATERRQVAETTDVTEARGRLEQAEATRTVSESAPGNELPLAVGGLLSETDSVQDSEVETQTAARTRTQTAQLPALKTAQFQAPQLSFEPLQATSEATGEQTQTVNETLRERVTATTPEGRGRNLAARGLPLGLGAFPATGDASGLDSDAVQYEYELGDPIAFRDEPDPPQSFDLPGLEEE